MKIALSWLQEYLPVKLEPRDTADRLTTLGLEVDKIEETSVRFSGVVIGEVLSVTPHPNAEKLVIAIIFDGSEELQIVCGAKNCYPGMKTALAKIGATLYDSENKPWKIKRAKLRDVESFGMLCTEKELFLGEDESGVMDYRGLAAPGTDLSSLFADTLFEISLTPNLGRCLSILGIARELAATFGCAVQPPQFHLEESLPAHPMSIQIKDMNGCSAYACRIVKDLHMVPAPEWMKKRLEIAGIRSIDGMVDIANYVMIEMGQPLHFFDLEKLSGNQIEITSYSDALSMMTLDGQMRPIPQGALMICNEGNPIAFAGVMGGLDSAVSERTRHILIEAAHFAPHAIRKSRKVLDLHSDSSYRFERGTDPGALQRALNRAAFLLHQICRGKVCKGVTQEITKEIHPLKIELRVPQLNRLLGTHMSAGEVTELLSRLEMKIEASGSSLFVTIPSYRNDILREIDLVEEVARIFGYGHLPKHPGRHVSSRIPHTPIYLFENGARKQLIGEGLQEWITCDLISPMLSELAGEKDDHIKPIPVLHPRSLDQSILRTTLLPGLLEAIKYNLDRGQPDLAAFEVGRIHFQQKNTYREMVAAGIVMTGKNRPYHFDPKPQNVDFYDLKGTAENVMEGLGIRSYRFVISHLPQFHPGRQARIYVGDAAVGVVGEVHPDCLKVLGIDQRVYYAELNLHDLHSLCTAVVRVIPFSNVPGSERDWTVTLDEKTPIGTIFDAIQKLSSKYLEKVTMVDLFRSDKIGVGKKNATFRFFYRDPDQTIEQLMVDREHQQNLSTLATMINQIF